MQRFDSANFMSLSADGQDLDIFSARFKDIRFGVPSSVSVEVDSATEANLPGLADKYLGDQALWWIILEYNGLVDPIEDITPGTVLRIPERRSVIQYLDARPATELSSVIEI
jgi:nucleoid-associated protein YgaU